MWSLQSRGNRSLRVIDGSAAGTACPASCPYPIRISRAATPPSTRLFASVCARPAFTAGDLKISPLRYVENCYPA
jgi:hypothetical protein